MENNNANLEDNSQSTKDVQKTVNDYANEANGKLETSIKQFNEQFEKQKEQLENQWGNDLKGYKSQYDDFDNSVHNQLGLFFTKGTNDSDDSGVYTNFFTNASVFKKMQSKRIEELINRINELEKQVVELTILKEDIAKKYYNDQTATPETATEDQVKMAISNLLSPIEKESEIKEDGNYIQAINDELSQLQNAAFPSAADFPTLLQTLTTTDLLTPTESAKLDASYQIVTEYEPTLTGNGNQFNLLETTSKENLSSVFTVTSTVGVSLKPGTNQILDFSYIFNAGSSGTIELINLEAIRAGLEQQMNARLSLSDYTAIVTVNGTQLSITIGLKEISNIPPQAPLTNEMLYTFDSEIQWDYPNDVSSNEYFQCNYSWRLNGTSTSGQLATYIDKDQPLKEYLQELFRLFTSLTSTAEKITTIYADPLMLDIIHFSEYVMSNPGKSFSELATQDSVYWLYNNVTDVKKITQISDSLYQNYKANGDSLYNDIVEQINKLESTIGTSADKNEEEAITLYGTLNLMTIPDMMLQDALVLGNWFNNANQEIEKTYHSWKETEHVALESIITDTNVHPDKNETATINATTENLVKSIQVLASSSKETAKIIEEAAAKVKDVAPTIEGLKESTDKVKGNANDILINLDKTVADVQKKTDDHSKYAEAFNKVLSNTKNGGSDNKTVFNFLSNPIQEKGEFGKTRQNSLIPYYATIIATFIILLVAIAMQKYMKRRKMVKTDLLLNPSRAWYNMSNMRVILLSSIVLSSAFSLTLSFIVRIDTKFSWFTYAFLVLLAGLLLTLGCMRQFRLLMIYLSGAILGLFFMLTPLLGVTTKTGTFTNILYRISPLQNIQNGFTALSNGASIGWGSYLILGILAVSGLLLNFLAKPEDEKTNV